MICFFVWILWNCRFSSRTYVATNEVELHLFIPPFRVFFLSFSPSLSVSLFCWWHSLKASYIFQKAYVFIYACMCVSCVCVCAFACACSRAFACMFIRLLLDYATTISSLCSQQIIYDLLFSAGCCPKNRSCSDYCCWSHIYFEQWTTRRLLYWFAQKFV